MFFPICLFLPVLSLAAPMLERGASYSVKKEKTEAAGAFSALSDYQVETFLELESYGSDGKELKVRSETQNRVRIRRLPEKDGNKSEVTFERFQTTSQVPLPGFAKPFVNRQDMTPYLAGKTLRIAWNGGQIAALEGVDSLRSRLSSEIKDPIARTSLLMVFSEDILRKNFTSLNQEGLCLKEVKGRKPGDKWKESAEQEGFSLAASCVFDGWAEEKGKKIAVITFSILRQKAESVLPNGKKQSSETEGTGRILWEPESRETLLLTDVQVSVLPSLEEIKKLEAARKEIPRARSRVKTWSHHYFR